MRLFSAIKWIFTHQSRCDFCKKKFRGDKNFNKWEYFKKGLFVYGICSKCASMNTITIFDRFSGEYERILCVCDTMLGVKMEAENGL